VRGSNPVGGEIIRTSSDRPWGPPCLLYNEYRLFPGLKRPGRGSDHPPPSSAEVKERIARAMRWAGHVARMGEERGVYRVLVGKPEGKRPLRRPRRRWVDNIRMDLQEVGCWHLDWMGLAQDRDRWRTLVSAVMNLGGSVICGEFLD